MNFSSLKKGEDFDILNKQFISSSGWRVKNFDEVMDWGRENKNKF